MQCDELGSSPDMIVQNGVVAVDKDSLDYNVSTKIGDKLADKRYYWETEPRRLGD